MNTRIAIIAEGPTDFALLPPLVSHIAETEAQYTWPVDADDMATVLPVRKRGHGGVLEKVRALVAFLGKEPLGYDLFIILLDRKTQAVQDAIRRSIRGNDRFVVGIAREEIEAWWLGDRTNTLAWSGFTHSLPGVCRYAAAGYAAEKDDGPKSTLNELTQLSDRFDSVYGDGNTALASDFAENYWRRNARLDEIAAQCPVGFGEFRRELANAFRAVRARSGNLF